MWVILLAYIVSKLAINAPAPAIIISCGATIASNGGSTPVEPRALNIFVKKYTAKHVIIPMPNFKPKL